MLKTYHKNKKSINTELTIVDGQMSLMSESDTVYGSIPGAKVQRLHTEPAGAHASSCVTIECMNQI